MNNPFVGLGIAIIIATLAIALVGPQNSAILRAKYDACIRTNLRTKLDQLALLDYQINNGYVSYFDSIGSKSYIDFLQEKADNLCKEVK